MIFQTPVLKRSHFLPRDSALLVSALEFQLNALCLQFDPQYLPTWYLHPSARPLF